MGFTLIELLIVIVVLGIFARGSRLRPWERHEQGRERVLAQADAKTVETALAAYNAYAGVYPTIPVGGINGGSTSTTLANTAGMSPRTCVAGRPVVGHYFIGLGMTTVNASPCREWRS